MCVCARKVLWTQALACTWGQCWWGMGAVATGSRCQASWDTALLICPTQCYPRVQPQLHMCWFREARTP